jgi:hypothetical protein
MLSRGFSIVLKGRVRVKHSIPNAGEFYTRDLGISEIVGNPYLIGEEQNRRLDAICLRKSELVNIQLCAYATLALAAPQVGLNMSSFIGKYAAGAINERIQPHSGKEAQRSSPRTIAVLALSSEIPVELFTARLVKAIVDTGIKDPRSMVILDSDKITTTLGGDVFNNAGNVRLESYLVQNEENAELTLLVGDFSPHSTWTRACMANVSHAFVHSTYANNFEGRLHSCRGNG